MKHPDNNEQCQWRVLRLREWGSERTYPLPAANAHDDVEEGHEIRVAGAGVPFPRARLSPEGNWWLETRDSVSLHADGEPLRSFMLLPGMEICIGTKLLVAETQREIRLRAYCQRLLGWGQERQQAVDHALRSLRLTRTRRGALFLQGAGDLVPIAHGLHRRVLGANTPFVVCDRRRTEGVASVRSPTNVRSAEAAVAAAVGGSVCVRHPRLPRDFAKAQSQLCDPRCDVQLYVCMDERCRDITVTGAVPVELPPLKIRQPEIPRIIDEYAKEALAAFNASPECFTTADRIWAHRHAHSISEIEKMTSRVVAVRSSNNTAQAASLLGMAPVSLSRWLARRSFKDQSSKNRVQNALEMPTEGVDTWTAST